MSDFNSFNDMAECEHCVCYTKSDIPCCNCGVIPESCHDEKGFINDEKETLYEPTCRHIFDCHSSDPHCTKCGINRSEIE